MVKIKLNFEMDIIKLEAMFKLAESEELKTVWQAIESFRIFYHFHHLKQEYREGKIAIHISQSQNSIAVTGLWRHHLKLGAIKAFVTTASEAKDFLDYLVKFFLRQGYREIISPLAPAPWLTSFTKYGFKKYKSVVVYRKEFLHPVSENGIATLKELSPGELKRVFPIDKSCFDPFWQFGYEEMLELLNNGQGFVAILNNRIVGYNLNTAGANSGSLIRLAVEPKYQRRGIGWQLLAKANNWFLNQGLRSASLCTQKENVAAQNLYWKFGFRPVEEQYMFIYRKDYEK